MNLEGRCGDRVSDFQIGSFHEVKGKIKEVTGKVTGKGDLKVAGNNEKVGGKIQRKVGQVKTVLNK